MEHRRHQERKQVPRKKGGREASDGSDVAERTPSLRLEIPARKYPRVAWPYARNFKLQLAKNGKIDAGNDFFFP